MKLSLECRTSHIHKFMFIKPRRCLNLFLCTLPYVSGSDGLIDLNFFVAEKLEWFMLICLVVLKFRHVTTQVFRFNSLILELKFLFNLINHFEQQITNDLNRVFQINTIWRSQAFSYLSEPKHTICDTDHKWQFSFKSKCFPMTQRVVHKR